MPFPKDTVNLHRHLFATSKDNLVPLPVSQWPIMANLLPTAIASPSARSEVLAAAVVGGKLGPTAFLLDAG